MMLEIKLNKELNRFKLVHKRPSHTKEIGYSHIYSTLGNTIRAAKTLQYYLENTFNPKSLIDMLYEDNTFTICAPNGHILVSKNDTPRKNRNTIKLISDRKYADIKITEYSDKYETIY